MQLHTQFGLVKSIDFDDWLLKIPKNRFQVPYDKEKEIYDDTCISVKEIEYESDFIGNYVVMEKDFPTLEIHSEHYLEVMFPSFFLSYAKFNVKPMYFSEKFDIEMLPHYLTKMGIHLYHHFYRAPQYFIFSDSQLFLFHSEAVCLGTTKHPVTGRLKAAVVPFHRPKLIMKGLFL